MSTVTGFLIRRELLPGDPDAIVELHRRVYIPEYGRTDEFLAGVGRTIEAALARGWPQRAGAAWLVEHESELAGSLALTHEGGGRGRVRWFVFGPALRGQGLGRRLLAELLDGARAAGYQKLELETFSALSAAAHLYRDAGFRVTWERGREDWGPPVVYQHYELEL